MSRKDRGSAWKWLLSLVGLGIFAGLVAKIGLSVVLRNLTEVGWWFAVVFMVGLVWLGCQALAWTLIQAVFRPVPFLPFFRAKIIADGMNTILPAANVGGDALRAVVVKDLVPFKESVPVIIFDKTLEFTATLFYLVAGLLLSVLNLKFPGELRVPVVFILAGILVGIAVLVFLQFRGVAGLIRKVAPIIPGGRKWVAEKEDVLLELDANMRFLYGRSKTRIAAAFGLHLIGRILGAVEIYIILRAMGLEAGFTPVVFISVIVVLMNTALFIMPGQWGISEGAHVLAGAAVGYTAPVALSLGIIRRLRKVLVAGLAVFLLSLKKESIKTVENNNVG